MLRPGFYMQNLSTVYREDIRERDEIFIPAGRRRTSFVDVRDIGEVAALVLTEKGHRNRAYTLTGSEALNYYEVAEIMSDVLERKITYCRPSFRAYKRILAKKGYSEQYIKVQRMLYMPVRLGFAKEITDDIEKLLGRKPYTMREYVAVYADCWR